MAIHTTREYREVGLKNRIAGVNYGAETEARAFSIFASVSTRIA